MSRKSPNPTEIEWRVLDDLQALDGKCWKEARGEYHGAYDEMAVWILLMKAQDIDAAHRKFRDVILPYSGLVRFTVSYSLRVPEGEMLLEALSGDEIALIGVERPLGSNPTLKHSSRSVFRT
jgi:hypothetical protein